MSAVNLCERCGALMLAKAVTTITVTTITPPEVQPHTIRYEFCPGCLQEFATYLLNAGPPAQRTYRKPIAVNLSLDDDDETQDSAPALEASNAESQYGG